MEDFHNDIIGKAQRGLKLTDDTLAKLAGVSRSDIERVKSGEADEAIVRKLAKPLHLGEEALAVSARQSWHPGTDPIEGIAQFNTPFADMGVNAYVVWDPESRQAGLFDTGSDATEMLELVRQKGLEVKGIWITHTHQDHIADLGRLQSETRAKVYSPALEPLPESETFPAGHVFQIGNLTIETRVTSGHSKGGITYVIKGLGHPVAVVGDALFAGSMGGGMVSYEDALANNRQKILSLPDDTIVCPGHGPLTTIAQEKRYNPFFPELNSVENAPEAK